METQAAQRKRVITQIYLAAGLLFASAAAMMGINDNPPGVLLAFLAATAFVLALAHGWRRARQFLYLLLGAAGGFVILVVLMIGMDMTTQNPSSPGWLLAMIASPLCEGLTTAFILLFPAGVMVGGVGALVMSLRRRREG